MTAESARDRFDRVADALRPALYRYCARMTGSVVDGEDVVQDTLVKALVALPDAGVIDNLESYLFRIAHNAVLDILRRRARSPVMQNEDVLEMIPAPEPDIDHEAAAASLRTFMRLPALQRSSVILKDVLVHSLEEIASITGTTHAAVKSALQRGRVRLRQLAHEPDDSPPMLSDAMRARLNTYVDGFKNGDFDTVRAMLADDVRLDLVAKLRKHGKGEVGEYYGAYAAAKQWAFAAGVVDGKAAMLVYDRGVSLDVPAYFVALEFDGDRVASIHDFLYARYALEGVDIDVLA